VARGVFAITMDGVSRARRLKALVMQIVGSSLSPTNVVHLPWHLINTNPRGG